MEGKCSMCGRPVENGIGVEIDGKERVFHEECLEENMDFIQLIIAWSLEKEAE